ncbi:hypothetical protein F4808DRAFT_461098 [Astrocystis sublimbata]|nr:hypothetical protein F4808DRAFT_461098 [Astrocystis sublimbata]
MLKRLPRVATALLLPWLTLGVSQSLKVLLNDPSNNWVSTTTISFPRSQAFFDATLRWDKYAQPTFSAAISPGVEVDVIKSVKLATSHNIPFLATGGRHGYTTTLATLTNGLAIDLKTVTSQCPGQVGSTLGAGVGRDEGRYGLAIDALLSVRLVTADARLIEVSATSHPDLFWAIRGAGANFGIITYATYRLHRITKSNRKVTNVDMIFPANMSSLYFDTIIASYNGSLPPLLAAETIISYDVTSNAPQLLANWVYYGPESEARKVLAPILGLNPPVVNISVIPWNQLLDTVFFGSDSSNCVGNRTASLYGVNMRVMTASTYQHVVEKMGQFYADNVNGRGSILTLEMFPNKATLAIPDSSTAYPWRETVAAVLIIMIDPDESALQLGLELRNDLAATSGFPGLAVYVSYSHGDETLEQRYGSAKLPKLVALKKKWDPKNMFGFSNPLPTSYP